MNDMSESLFCPEILLKYCPVKAPLMLMLPETQQAIKAMGYTGIKAYLYSGYSELAKLLFMSATYFAVLHDDMTVFQYKARILRIRIVKAVIFSLTFASVLTAFFFLPPAAGLIPVIIKSGILLSTAAFSLTFFGITVHSLYNFIERVKFVPFTVFTIEKIKDKLQGYRGLARADLENDVNVLTGNKERIKLLFENPNVFKEGLELKFSLQNLIETYFLKAIETNNTAAQDSLVNLIYGFYIHIDSPALQEVLIFGYEKAGEADMSAEKYAILKFFYTINAQLFESNYNESGIIHKINNQRRMIRLFLSGNKLEEIEDVNSKIEDGRQSTIFINTKLGAFNSVSESDLRRQLNEVQLRKMKSALNAMSKMKYLFEDIQRFQLPKQIGYMYVKAIKNRNALQYILSDDVPAEDKLHALLRLSTIERSPFSFEARFARSVEKYYGAMKEAKITISKDIENELYKESKKILDYASKNKIDTGNGYFDSLEAEMLFTAAAVLLHEKYPEVDLVGFLKQLQFTFVRNYHTEQIIRQDGSNESEYVRIPMNDHKEYIVLIQDFVESLYKEIKDGESDRDERIKTVAKGFSAQIRIVRKDASLSLTLDETEKMIAERNYTGIIKYLYIGYAELERLLLMSSELFAALHDNVSKK